MCMLLFPAPKSALTPFAMRRGEAELMATAQNCISSRHARAHTRGDAELVLSRRRIHTNTHTHAHARTHTHAHTHAHTHTHIAAAQNFGATITEVQFVDSLANPDGSPTQLQVCVCVCVCVCVYEFVCCVYKCVCV